METVLNGKQQSDQEACEGTDPSDFEMGAGRKKAQIYQEPPNVSFTDDEKETGQNRKGDKQDGLVCASHISLAEEKDPNLPPPLPPKTRKYLQNQALNQESNLNKMTFGLNSHQLQESAGGQDEHYNDLLIHHLPTVHFEKENKATNPLEIPQIQDLEVTWKVKSYEEATGGCKEETEDDEAVNKYFASKTRSKMRGRSASMNSVFGSFEVDSSFELVKELLSGEEWARFLDNCHNRSPAVPHPSASEVTAQPTTDVFNPKPHQETLLNEFDCSDCDKEHERIHKVIEICLRHNKQTEEQQASASSATEEKPLRQRTGAILKSVKFVDETQPSNTNAPEVQQQKHHRNKKKDGTLSPHKVIMSSIFYDVPASTEEDEAKPELTAAKPVRSTTRFLGRIKTKLRKQTRSETI